jgi:glycosyltransferase involved in cell wall biosynthesis
MKIAFDAKRAFFNFRGLGNYSRIFIDSLLEFYPEHTYRLYTPAFKDPRAVLWQQDHPAAEIVTPEGQLVKKWPALWRSALLRPQLQQDGIDVYHGLSNELPFFWQHGGPQRIKSVVTIHDLLIFRQPQFYPWIDRRMYARKMAHSCQVADRIIAISQQTKVDLMHYLDVDEEKIDVVYQSCDPAYYQRATDAFKQDVRQRWQLPKDYILYVGAINPAKNLATLLTAYAASSANGQLALVLVGRGPDDYRQRLQAQAEQLGITQSLRFCQDVPMNELPTIYQMATMLTYPSFFEGFGIPIIEALFSQTPVITSKDGCFTEAGGPSCRYIDPRDSEDLTQAISDLCDNSDLRQSMVAGGSRYVTRFHRKQTASDLMSVYQSLT